MTKNKDWLKPFFKKQPESLTSSSTLAPLSSRRKDMIHSQGGGMVRESMTGDTGDR